MKTRKLFFAMLLLATGIATIQAQGIKWDKEKYPDFNPTPRFNKVQQTRMKASILRQTAKGKTRPDHWNNAESNAFPPVMNQSAGSCGSASRIYYMFAHEMNAARWADGSKAENIYPTHFTWLLTWCPGGQGKEIIAQHNGIPNSEVYGGYTYSEDFGYQDCDTKDSNYGFMQGYDKWLHAMNNRITGAANFPAVDTEEGSELVKNYLWNHCGDETYSTGGIVGVGVAASLTSGTIPSTTANKAAGVVGMHYVQHWGESVDHALTIVGYDDRIEFDLDANGKTGEASNSKGQNEVGAWIIVNSWGNWKNNGFIYCPYAEARPTATATGYWTPEYYTPRRDYRPLRTLKVKMDYDHRSEIALYVGVAKDLNATAPEKETWLRHFYYAGLGKGVTVNADNPDPAIPMLGKWADGDLHTEPMEFGYDLTDLVSGIDDGQPLKYFFRVETRAWAQGAGHIYKASIIDYTTDREGVEIPFDLPADGQTIANAGQKTTITTNASYEKIPAPYNLSITGNTLSWNQPLTEPYPIKGYRIYQDNVLLKEVDGNTLSADIDPVGTFKVSAVYDVNGSDSESELSAAAIVPQGTATDGNDVLTLTNAIFTIPAFTTSASNAYTIEFWMRPSTVPANGAFGLKASNGKFFFKMNTTNALELGFDGGDYAKGPTISTNKYAHIAIVISGNNLQLYVDGTRRTNFTSGYSNSLSGVNDLLVGITEGTTSSNKQRLNAPLNGYIDELRIWNCARTADEIKSAYKDSYAYPMLQNHLTHCYKMDIAEQDDNVYMVDAKRQHDINLTEASVTYTHYKLATGNRFNPLTPAAASDFNIENSAFYVGVPVKIRDLSSPSTIQWNWAVTGAEQSTMSTSEPVIVFNTAGEQTITLNTTNISGATNEKVVNVNVQAAQAPTADFRLPSDKIAAGEHITFINTSTPLQEATYEWTLEGADQEISKATNASVTYKSAGTYAVRLKATTAAGSHSVEKQIQVVKVAPQSAFTIQNNVAIKGEKINLIDASKYDPSSWKWTIFNSQVTYLVNDCQSGSVTIDRPGIYDVTLTTANEIGKNSLTRSNAITVCNADGHTGLKFDAEDDELVAPSPFPAQQTSYVTLEWWMYPGTLLEKGCQMGDAASTFLLNTNADGSMNVYVKSSLKKSDAGFVIPNEWHHYAVVYSSGSVTFYRDGVQFGSSVTPGTNRTKWSQFRMGGSEAPMNAIVDELRLWYSALSVSKIRELANEPLQDPENAQSLLIYYDFNQSSGDVTDHSKNHYTGVRSNFGPDGDAWTSSRGIFYLDFTNNKTDITSTYLKNYKAAFATGTGYVNGTTRFKKLGSPWIQENSVVNGNVTTEFHVDGNKDNNLTISTSWDGFASEVKNLKLYQVVTLPAGAYELNSISARSERNYDPNFLAVAAGTGLPDYADLASEALGYARCNKNCVFVLNEPTEVSIGIVSNQSGQKCHTISQFVLYSTEMHELKPGEIYDGIDDLQDEVVAEPTLQAFGGLGTIRIAVSEPQEVVVVNLAGAVIWQGFVVKQATIPARKGIYVVSRQKVMVR